MLIILKLFQKTEKQETLPNLFYKATITVIPKSEKNIRKENYKKKRENYRSVSLMNIDLNSLIKILTEFDSTLKESYTSTIM